MALQDILEKIKKEAAEAAKKLDEAHKNKLKKLEEEYEAMKKDAAKDMDAKVEFNSKKIIEKAETLAKMEAKNELLKAKRKIIDTAFTESIEKLVSSGKYEAMVEKLLKKSELEGEAEVVPAKGKEDATKAALKASGKSFKLAEKSANIKGGFLLRTAKVEMDNSFESIVGKELKDELELEVSKVLF
jgi:vacuolar-type H+-ATPase subunit E/Vma4